MTPAAWTNPYKAAAYTTGGQTIPINTWNKIQLNTVVFDTNSNFDNTTNYRYTFAVAGYYQINAQVIVGSSGMASTGFATAAIYKNNTAFYIGPRALGSGNALSIPTIPMSTFAQFAAGDYIELWGYNGDASTGRSTGACSMSVFLVSET